MSEAGRHRVLIAGGGIAGLEALLALSDLAADRVEITVIAPANEFVYKPLAVEEPFAPGTVERRELAPIVEGEGGFDSCASARPRFGPSGVYVSLATARRLSTTRL